MYLKFKIYNCSPDYNISKKPFYMFYVINDKNVSKQHSLGPMLLDFLIGVKNSYDPFITFRRSCREGICGSCAMNYNGKNVLACTTRVDLTKDIHYIHPLPHLPVIRDLVVDLNYFYNQHKNVHPWLKRKNFLNLNILSWFNKKEIIHSRKNRNRIDGLYECILCACCSTSCPSYWWNQSEYLGPAVLLQAYRWLLDSRDINSIQRLSKLYNPFKVYRCHSILNCTKVCPKGLDPAYAIDQVKKQLDNLILEKYFKN